MKRWIVVALLLSTAPILAQPNIYSLNGRVNQIGSIVGVASGCNLLTSAEINSLRSELKREGGWIYRDAEDKPSASAADILLDSYDRGVDRSGKGGHAAPEGCARLANTVTMHLVHRTAAGEIGFFELFDRLQRAAQQQ